MDSAALARDWAFRFKPGTVYAEYFHKVHGEDTPTAPLRLSPEPDRPSIARDWELLTGGAFVCPVCQETVPRPLLVMAVGPFWGYVHENGPALASDHPLPVRVLVGDVITVMDAAGRSVQMSVIESIAEDDGRTLRLVLRDPPDVP